MPDRPVSPPDPAPQTLFPRAHKSALGLAFGMITGLGLFALTAIHVSTRADGLPLYLLAQYFSGYEVSWPGAMVGLAWGFAVGFVGGWLLGFVHNFTVGFWLFIVRTRHDLKQTRNFLDHI
jgi:hypothetical protein